MKKRDQLTALVCRYDSGLKSGDVVVAFEYDLLPDSSDTRVEGICALISSGDAEPEIRMYSGGELKERYPLKDCSDFACNAGVGCVMIEYKLSGEDRMLCRADNSYSKLYAAVVKRINRYKDKHVYSYDYEEDLLRFCPKCGRPIHPGMSICEHCVSKGKYLKRLWDIAKPYKWYIFLTTILFFVVTLINMLPPYINRVLVDDYITPKNAQLVGFLSVIGAMVAVQLLSRVVGVWRNLTQISVGNKVIIRLRSMVFEKIQALSLSNINRRTSGELMNRVTGDTRQLNEFITRELSIKIDRDSLLLLFDALSIPYVAVIYSDAHFEAGILVCFAFFVFPCE